jgi:tryptophan 7-halogenase
LGDNRIRKIVIVGGGTAGWMTAACLARTLGRGAIRIHLVESEEIGTIGVGESTLPAIHDFNAMLGLNEAEFMAATEATFKLGIEFSGWSRPGDRYFNSFTAYGQPLGGVPFHHHWLRLRLLGDDTPMDSYSLPIVAAKLERFGRVPPDAVPSHFPYAFQFDALLYAAYLRRYAERLGVERTEGKVVTTTLRPDDGFIESIKLASGENIAGDLFVDCSGFRGVLVEQALATGYEDWSRWLPCDRSIAVPCESAGAAVPFTRAMSSEAGWRWRIPLQHRVGNGTVYCSRFLSDDDAWRTLEARLEGKALAAPRVLGFVTGRRRKQWNRNCVAVGLAGGFLEPLESTSIGFIQYALFQLVQLFPDRTWSPSDAEEFNRIMDEEFERVRDLLVLHYHATERADTPFWDHCRTMPVPDSLAAVEELFRARGFVAAHRDSLFGEPSWLAVFLGQNVVPDRYDPLSDTMDTDSVRFALGRIRDGLRASAERLPLHRDFVASYCATAH